MARPVGQMPVIAVLLLLLTACGGGGTSSGGTPVLSVSYSGTSLVSGAGASVQNGTDFGSDSLSGASITRNFMLTNSGTTALIIPSGAAQISGSDPGDFSSTLQPGSLKPGETTTLAITFKPSAEGVRSAMVTLASNAGSFSMLVAGSGTTPHLIVRAPGAVPVASGVGTPNLSNWTDFSNIRVGLSLTRNFTIKNTGTEPLKLNVGINLSIGGATQGFALALGSTTVPPGGNTTLEVTFSPTGAAFYSSTITISNNTLDQPSFSFSVKGRGVVGVNQTYTISFPQIGAIIPIDIDGDGADEVVVVHNTNGSEPEVYEAYKLNTTGNWINVTGTLFIPDPAIEANSPVRHAIVTDINHDGHMDLIVASTGPELATGNPLGQSLIFMNDGHGHLVDVTASQFPSQLGFTHDICAADVKGDGYQDIYLSNISGGNTAPGVPNDVPPMFYMNDGTNHFSVDTTRVPASMLNLDPKFTSCTFVDANEDGHPDMILGFHGSSGVPPTQDTLLLNDGMGNFRFAPASAMPTKLLGSQSQTETLIPGDFNNDGLMDVLAVTIRALPGQPNYSTLQIYLNNGDGTFSDGSSGLDRDWSPYFTFSGASFGWVWVIDANNDGRPDILTDGNGVIPVLLLQTSPLQFTISKTFDQLDTLGHMPSAVIPGDFNGDGVVDFLLVYID